MVFAGDARGQLDDGLPQRPELSRKSGRNTDFGSASVLRTLSGGKQVLVATQKTGVVYGLDPDRARQNPVADAVGSGRGQGGIQWGGALDDHTIYAAVSDLNRM